jgi:hypothetical protein
VQFLQEAGELALVPNNVLQHDDTAAASLRRGIPELPALEVVWDAEEDAGLCVQLKTATLLATHMGPSMAAEDTEHGVVRLALVCHLKRSCASGNRGRGDHVEQAGVRVERLAPESCGEASAIQHSNNVLLQHAIVVFRNAALLQHALHGVLATNAGLCKVCVPDVADVLAALVVVQTLDRHAILESDKGLEHLEHLENIQLVLEQVDPPITQPVVGEGDSVVVAGAEDVGTGTMCTLE